MRPRNDREREVVGLFTSLPAITEKQKQWAFDNCFKPIGFKCKNNVWCSHCGHSFSNKSSELAITLIGDECICPQCGARLELKNSRKQKHSESWYYMIATTCKGWQVLRHFIVDMDIRKGGSPYYCIHEAVQNWIDKNGNEVVIARQCAYMPHIYDKWNFSKPMDLRDHKRSQRAYTPDKYDIDAAFVYPTRRLLPIIKRNGYSFRCNGLSQRSAIKLILTDREAEILAKNKQYSLLALKDSRGIREFCMPYAHSIRIANRNKYIVKDATMWMDYLDLLAYFNLDTHNAHYVCPKDLKAEHDRLQKRKHRIEQERAIAEKRMKAEQWEEQYRIDKAKYFGICFGNEDIIITVIRSVADMAEEGQAMHHCVYDMGYYKKKESLILSARGTHDGKRIETIEVNLKTFKVVQSRGVCNSNTEYHDIIVNLVNQNINLIKQAA